MKATRRLSLPTTELLLLDQAPQEDLPTRIVDLTLMDLTHMDLDHLDLRLEAQAPQAAHQDQLDQAETPAQYQVILAHFSEIHIIFD